MMEVKWVLNNLNLMFKNKFYKKIKFYLHFIKIYYRICFRMCYLLLIEGEKYV